MKNKESVDRPTRMKQQTNLSAWSSVWAVILLLMTSAGSLDAESRPNIVFIMADDLGKEWIGCYGATEVKTPNIDALAANGMRFNNAYSMPQCTPTRVTLLTGQYPFRHGWTNHFDVPRWGSGCHFDATLNASFAKVVRGAGYATAAAGKWQIDDFRVEPQAMLDAGFDEWCMWTGGEGGNQASHQRYWDPYIHTRHGSQTYSEKFGPDVFCDFLIDFMQRNQQKPMLLYFPMALTHPPLVATPDEPNVSTKIDKHKAMVRYTDKLVGRLVSSLNEFGLRDKTIIIFTTDNGTSRGIAGTRLGRQVPGAKSKLVEAGTAMPFIVSGPSLVPAGVVTNALTDFTDLLPTIAELSGARLDDRFTVDGRSIAPLLLGNSDDTGRDWIVSMGGGPATFRDNRVVPMEPFDDRVIRDKRWKLWVGTDRQPQALYDLQNDPWEEHNLIDSDEPTAVSAKKNLWSVVETMPRQDAAPIYTPNPPQDWDKHDFVSSK